MATYITLKGWGLVSLEFCYVLLHVSREPDFLVHLSDCFVRNFSIWSPTQTPRTDEGASSLLGSGLGGVACFCMEDL